MWKSLNIYEARNLFPNKQDNEIKIKNDLKSFLITNVATERHYIPRLVREAIEITKKRELQPGGWASKFQLSRARNPVAPLCI